jgi:hypothetical protein
MSDSPRMVYLTTDAPKLEELGQTLRSRFATANVENGDGEIRLTIGAWTARVVDLGESWVAVEAKELAERAPAEARALLAGSSRRLEIYGSGNPELDDDHYNDALAIWETLSELPNTVGHDPFDGSFHAAR